MNTPPRPTSGGLMQRLWAAHFHDYTHAAFRMWLGIALAGAAALAWAVISLSAATPTMLWQTMVGLALVGVAAWFPVELPRSKYSISAADAFVFAMLAIVGPCAAILAAGLEGALGSWRSTKRVSSRISTPCAAMAAMTVCGLLFLAVVHGLTSIFGLDVAVAELGALVTVAWVPFVLTTLPLMSTVTLKRGAWPQLSTWLSSFGWVAAVYLASATVAGMVQLIATNHGLLSVAVIAAAVLSVVGMLRATFARVEQEHQGQEGRVVAAEKEAEVNQQRFAAAFEDAAIGMAIVDDSGHIVRVNKAICELVGSPPGQLTTQRFSALLHPSDVSLFERQVAQFTQRDQQSPISIELRCLAQDGREVWVSMHCGRFSLAGSSHAGLILQLHDITSRQVAEKRLHHIAFHDSLTDLANRARFSEQLEAAVEASRTNADVQFAILFLDLDRFKVVNDSLGHFAGNELLREIALRLQHSMPSDVLVARLGGDEFGVLQNNLTSHDQGLRLATHMLALLAEPLTIQGHEIVPSASIGITFSDKGARSVDELLRDADLAMYEAKSSGRHRVAVFDRSMHERIADKLTLEAELRRAIGEGELTLNYQPIYSLSPQRLTGFEALARWVHPTRGPISPALFIALAEESGQIQALTGWVIERALSQLAAWRRQSPDHADVVININMSGHDLMAPGFVDNVLAALARHGVRPQQLMLEITESVLMGQLEGTRANLNRLRECGVQVAIDDFGTGYSSLAYLSTLPIDCLKIDRSFVMAMDDGHQSEEIVRAILMLGCTLSKRVVAEGVETHEQLETLRRLGVHAAQGYLLGKPMRADQVLPMLQRVSGDTVDASKPSNKSAVADALMAA